MRSDLPKSLAAARNSSSIVSMRFVVGAPLSSILPSFRPEPLRVLTPRRSGISGSRIFPDKNILPGSSPAFR